MHSQNNVTRSKIPPSTPDAADEKKILNNPSVLPFTVTSNKDHQKQVTDAKAPQALTLNAGDHKNDRSDPSIFVFTEMEEGLLSRVKKRYIDSIAWHARAWTQYKLAALVDIYHGKHPSVFNPDQAKADEYLEKLLEYCEVNQIRIPPPYNVSGGYKNDLSDPSIFVFTEMEEELLSRAKKYYIDSISWHDRAWTQYKLAALVEIYYGKYPDIFKPDKAKADEYLKKLLEYCNVNHKQTPWLNNIITYKFLFTEAEEKLLSRVKKNYINSLLWNDCPEYKIAALVDIYQGNHPSVFEQNQEKAADYLRILSRYCELNQKKIPQLNNVITSMFPFTEAEEKLLWQVDDDYNDFLSWNDWIQYKIAKLVGIYQGKHPDVFKGDRAKLVEYLRKLSEYCNVNHKKTPRLNYIIPSKFLFTEAEEKLLLEVRCCYNDLWIGFTEYKIAALVDIYQGKHPSVFEKNQEKADEYLKKLLEYCKVNHKEIPPLYNVKFPFTEMEEELLSQVKKYYNTSGIWNFCTEYKLAALVDIYHGKYKNIFKLDQAKADEYLKKLLEYCKDYQRLMPPPYGAPKREIISDKDSQKKAFNVEIPQALTSNAGDYKNDLSNPSVFLFTEMEEKLLLQAKKYYNNSGIWNVWTEHKLAALVDIYHGKYLDIFKPDQAKADEYLKKLLEYCKVNHKPIPSPYGDREKEITSQNTVTDAEIRASINRCVCL